MSFPHTTSDFDGCPSTDMPSGEGQAPEGGTEQCESVGWSVPGVSREGFVLSEPEGGIGGV